jgi:hypothetical protein
MSGRAIPPGATLDEERSATRRRHEETDHAGAQRPQVDTRDLDETRMRLSDIYCPHKLTMSGGGRGFE